MRGVHLEDGPSSPLTKQFEEDFNECIRQLSNPSVTQCPVPRIMHPASSRQLNNESDVDNAVNYLANEMDRKCMIHSCSAQFSKNAKRGFRRTKSRHSEPSVEIDEAVDMSVGSNMDEDSYDMHEIPVEIQNHDANAQKVVFTCDSSPGDSDHETIPKAVCKKETKKRRFRKMLPRSLRRSHSAGSAKDIPSHALFLQYKTDDPERKESAASKALSEPEVNKDIDESEIHRPVRKTSSMDPATLGSSISEDCPSQSKGKSRNLARNVRRKLQFLKRRHTDTALGEDALKFRESRQGAGAIQGVGLWSQSFECLLMDKHGLALFRGFLRSEFSEENLEFWIACEDYKNSKTNKLGAKAQKIYSDFVVVQAPKEINLDSVTRGTTISNLANPTKNTFMAAQKRIQALMEKDSYRRFLESEIYQRLLSNHKS